jgi:hypothetical protein
MAFIKKKLPNNSSLIINLWLGYFAHLKFGHPSCFLIYNWNVNDNEFLLHINEFKTYFR